MRDLADVIQQRAVIREQRVPIAKCERGEETRVQDALLDSIVKPMQPEQVQDAVVAPKKPAGRQRPDRGQYAQAQ